MGKDLNLVAKDSGGFKPLKDSKFYFPRMSEVFPGLFGTTEVGTGPKCVALGTYDFSVSGGATGAITLLPGDDLIPANAVITSVYIDTISALTSGGSATVAIGVNTTTDLLTATAYASFTGITAGIPVSTAATAVKTTAECNITITIGTAALTAGKFNVIAEYVVSA